MMTTSARVDYPLPETVAAYGTRAEFEASRVESGQWVFWDDRVQLVLQGRYRDVIPLHVELSPTYLCNFACPWCSCRAAREDWSDEDVFNHPSATPQTVMSGPKLDAILRHLAEHRIGIMWVGGEPTMHQLLYPAVKQAHELGLQQCLFTNGSLLSQPRIDALFEADLEFIRVSLDAATDSVHQRHHGYGDRRPYARMVKQNLEQLVERRKAVRPRTVIGVSLVVDEVNIGDLLSTARYLASLCERFGPGAISYVMVRPTYQFYTSQVSLELDTRARLREMVGSGSEMRSLLAPYGVDVIAPGDSFVDPAVAAPVAGETCLAASWFGEVTANGDMVVCSDRYGNPEYFVGNLHDSSVREIWSGERRREVFETVDSKRCLSTFCPRNGRGFHLNRVFHQIEALRRADRLADVSRWIDDLRVVLPAPAHPFFL